VISIDRMERPMPIVGVCGQQSGYLQRAQFHICTISSSLRSSWRLSLQVPHDFRIEYNNDISLHYVRKANDASCFLGIDSLSVDSIFESNVNISTNIFSGTILGHFRNRFVPRTVGHMRIVQNHECGVHSMTWLSLDQ